MRKPKFHEHPGLFSVMELNPVTSTWCPPTEFPDLSGAKAIAIDLETCDPNLKEKGPGCPRNEGYIAGIGIGTDDGYRAYFPMRHEHGGNLDPGMVKRWAKAQLCRPGQTKVGANILYDLEWLAHEGVPVAGPFYDVQMAEPLLDENKFSYSLETLSQDYLGEGKVSNAMYEWLSSAYGGPATRKAQAGRIHQSPVAMVGPYAESDVDLPLRIRDIQLPIMQEQDLMGVFDMESKLMPLLLGMRQRGVRVDIPLAEKVDAALAIKIKEDNVKFFSIFGKNANANVGESLAPFFDREGVHYPKTKTGKPSITKEWMMVCPHPAAQLVRQVRMWEKFRTTFVQGYILNSHVNGRLYGRFHSLKGDDNGTISGRFCVAGDTLLTLECGKTVRIDELTLTGREQIQTHTGNFRDIKKHIYKGQESMHKISLANGSQVTGTLGHQVLTPGGWAQLAKLSVGSEVCSYVKIEEAVERPHIFQESERFVPVPGAANDRRGLQSVGSSHSPHGDRNTEPRLGPSPLPFRKGNSIFQSQGRRKAPPVAEIPRKASPLEGWRCNNQGQTLYQKARLVLWNWKFKLHSFFSLRFSTGCGTDQGPPRISDSSHRQKPNEQRLEQPGSSDDKSPFEFPSSRVTRIESMGKQDVWDIEVDIDHSYLAQGMIHHNSSSGPNLENIPAGEKDSTTLTVDEEVRRLGKWIRALFVPDFDDDWASDDFCVTGDTEVITINGCVPIKDLVENLVPVLSSKDGKTVEFQPAIRGIDIGPAPVYLVTMEDGSTVRCTGEHKWMQLDGSFIKTKELKLGSRLAHVCDGLLSKRKVPTWYLKSNRRYVYNSQKCYFKARDWNHKVVSVEYAGIEPVYCIEVDNTHTFVLKNGLISSNSQVEYRIICHYGKGPAADKARAMYLNDPTTDFHNMVVEMTGLGRKRAKGINFGKAYGAGAETIANNMGCTVAEAKCFIEQYDREVPFVGELLKQCGDVATTRGYIKTILGRRAHFDLWEKRGSRFGTLLPRAKAEEQWGHRIQRAKCYTALNRLIQGSAADIFKKALELIQDSGILDVLGFPLNLVHDEICWSVPRTKIGREAHLAAVEIMKTAVPLSIPLLVDAEMGPSWGEVK